MNTPTTDDVLHSLGLARYEEPRVADWVTPVAFFGLGALTGAAAAVLLTPKSGPELRRDIRDGAKQLGDSVTTTIDNAIPDMRSKDVESYSPAVEIEAK